MEIEKITINRNVSIPCINFTLTSRGTIDSSRTQMKVFMKLEILKRTYLPLGAKKPGKTDPVHSRETIISFFKKHEERGQNKVGKT